VYLAAVSVLLRFVRPHTQRDLAGGSTPVDRQGQHHGGSRTDDIDHPRPSAALSARDCFGMLVP
jgi:hypothetical protein